MGIVNKSLIKNKNLDIKAVIFDMDGVIVDSEGLVSKSFEVLIKKKGKEPIFYENGVVQKIGLGHEAYKIVLKDRHNLDGKLEDLIKERRKIFWELFEQEGLLVMPGFFDFASTLKKRKIKLAVASNTNLDAVIKVLKKINAIDYFDIIISGENVKNYKPHPDIYLEAAKRLNVDPKKCMAIEDTETGVASGKAAGMFVIAVPNKHTKHQDFSKADLVLNNLKEIKI